MPPGVRRPEWSPENETLEHFERFAWTLVVPETGERLKLLSWQLAVLEDYFAGGARTPLFFQHLWEIPSGNGKSGLLGALALHHATYCVPRPRVFVVGGELEHARNTTNAAAGFINESKERNGLLGAWWEPQEHSGGRLLPLWLDDQDVGIFARSAGRRVERKGGSSVEGKNPTLILVEEKHRHEDGGAAVNTLIAKTIKSEAVGRVVKAVTITTAGTDRKSVLGEEIAWITNEEKGAKIQRDLREGEYYVRAVDPRGHTVGHIWEVPESVSPPKDDDEVDEFLGHVVKANPAPWISVDNLRRIWDAMTRFQRWMFLRQNANMWVAAGLGAIDRGQWWSLRSRGTKIPTGRGVRVFVGLDRASKWDSTAIVPVWVTPEGKVRVSGVVVLRSPRNGTRSTADVGGILEDMRKVWPNMVVVFDRNQGGGDVAADLEKDHGLTVIDHDQGAAFDLASMRLAEVVEKRGLEWDAPEEHREEFARQVLAAVVKPTSKEKWRGEAPDDEIEADAFDALAMAVHMATTLEVKTFNPDDYRIQKL